MLAAILPNRAMVGAFRRSTWAGAVSARVRASPAAAWAGAGPSWIAGHMPACLPGADQSNAYSDRDRALSGFGFSASSCGQQPGRGSSIPEPATAA